MSFAQVAPRRGWLGGHLVLARRLEDPRFRRVETFLAPQPSAHISITCSGDIDRQFRAWLAEAYQVGRQDHLHHPNR